MKGVVEECTRLVHDYVWYLDHPNEDVNKTGRDFANLFADDGILALANLKLEDQNFVGHEEIAARYLQSRTIMRFLHLMTNVRIIPTSDTTALGTNYVFYFIHPVGADMGSENAMSGVAEYRDEYRLTAKGWKISKRSSLVRLTSMQGTITAPTGL